ncbi:MAG: PD-(D/E)XK nuclease family protein [Anaerolineae bacterium]
MTVRLSDSFEHYLETREDGRVYQLDRVSHILQEVGLSPRFGRNARAGAEIGTMVHDHIKDFLKDGKVPTFREFDKMSDAEKAVLNCWVLFCDWWAASGLAPYQSERCVACGRLGYGGKLDLLATDAVTGEAVLVDFKTSLPATQQVSRTAYTLQLAAYALALEEMGEGLPTRALLVRLGKEEDQPDVHVGWETEEQARDALEAWERVVLLAYWMREEREARELVGR